jgi:hypothetical protein
VVVPKVKRIELSDGDFIDVNEELNSGQYLEMLRGLADRVPFAKAMAYVVGWSFVGVDGQPLPYDLDMAEPLRRTTLAALDKATMREMSAALDKHQEAEEKAIEAKKKTNATASASSAISTSAAR